MIQILFTTSDKLMSKWIRKITNEPVSHCAIQVGNFVIHSSVNGVEILPYDIFSQKNRIIYRISKSVLDSRVRTSLENTWGKKYDFGALLYLGLRYLFPRIIPKQNLWQTSSLYLCTEFVSSTVLNESDSLITPYKLYLKLFEERLKQ